MGWVGDIGLQWQETVIVHSLYTNTLHRYSLQTIFTNILQQQSPFNILHQQCFAWRKKQGNMVKNNTIYTNDAPDTRWFLGHVILGGEGGWREKGGEGDGGGGGSGKPRPPPNQDKSKQCIKLYDGSTFEFSSGKFGVVYQNNPPSILFNPAKPYYGHKLYQNILMRRLM